LGKVRVVRAEHYKKKWPLESEMARRLMVFRRRLEAEPVEFVTEEAVLVELSEDREKWIGLTDWLKDYYNTKDAREAIERFRKLPPEDREEIIAEGRRRGYRIRKIKWRDLYKKSHLHLDVQRFKDLIEAKKAAGLEITIADGVEAYLMVFGHGRKSQIAAFLWALGDEYPEFRMKHVEVKEKVKVKPLLGREREEVRVRRVAKPMESVEELIPRVGEALSRLRRKGVIR